MSQTQTSGMYEEYLSEGAAPVPYVIFKEVLKSAYYSQNRCCELTEIVEMFCLDAEGAIAAAEVKK